MISAISLKLSWEKIKVESTVEVLNDTLNDGDEGIEDVPAGTFSSKGETLTFTPEEEIELNEVGDVVDGIANFLADME